MARAAGVVQTPTHVPGSIISNSLDYLFVYQCKLVLPVLVLLASVVTVQEEGRCTASVQPAVSRYARLVYINTTTVSTII